MRTTQRWLTAGAVGVAVSLALTGCSDAASPTPSTSAALAEPSAPAAGGELIYALAADPICVDPNQTDLTASRDVARTFAASVLNADPITGEIVPWLASAWTVNDDATEYEF